MKEKRNARGEFEPIDLSLSSIGLKICKREGLTKEQRASREDAAMIENRFAFRLSFPLFPGKKKSNAQREIVCTRSLFLSRGARCS
jgi:hypothetical protein